MIPGGGNPVHANTLIAGDLVHLAPHDVHGTDWEGHRWSQHVECAEADVYVNRVRWEEGSYKAAVDWYLGSMRGSTVYGPTSLIPLIHRAA
jgi:hypothetical protein